MKNLRSSVCTTGRKMAGARSLWRANGMKEEQFGQPVIAVVNSFTQFVPGHVHLHEIGQQIKEWIAEEGCFAAEFDSQLTEHTVARVGERFLDILFAVSVRAGDFLATDVDRAGARPLALEQVGDVLDSGVDGHNLEDRARNRVRGQQAVDVNAVPGSSAAMSGGLAGSNVGVDTMHKISPVL